MSSINLSMSKTIEIIMSVLVILACLGMIYTYDAKNNYLLSFSSAKLKIIFDEVMMYHDKGLYIEMNERYPFDLRLYEDKIILSTIDLSKREQVFVTKIEPITSLNGKKTIFAEDIKLNSYKVEQLSLHFFQSQIKLESRTPPKLPNFCEKVKECNFTKIPKIYYKEIISDCLSEFGTPNIVCPD